MTRLICLLRLQIVWRSQLRPTDYNSEASMSMMSAREVVRNPADYSANIVREAAGQQLGSHSLLAMLDVFAEFETNLWRESQQAARTRRVGVSTGGALGRSPIKRAGQIWGVVHFWPFLGNRWARGSGGPLRVGLGWRGCFGRWRRSASQTQARWF